MRRRTNITVMTLAGAATFLWSVVPGAMAQVRPNPPNPLTIEGGTSLPDNPGSAIFFDNFEYNVSRSGTSADAPFAAHGWPYIKAENSAMARGEGYFYTQSDSTVGSRVLVLESVPSQSTNGVLQTDYYLQLGREGGPMYIPANVWFQFKTYATTSSDFARRDKVLYPCRTNYPCAASGGALGWMFLWGKGGFEASDASSPANRYFGVTAEFADNRGAAEYPTNAPKLYQNVNRIQLVAGRWYDMRLHFDTSGAQGVYQAWVREHGQSAWTLAADWRGGVTPNFFWPIPSTARTGHVMMRLPTTVNGPGDSTTYMDDFTMASSESALPR